MAKILVVDDEVSIRMGIREFAEYQGYEVEEAANGKEAVERCRQKDFDVIIMDIMMQEMDGYEAYKKIREIKDIPALMLDLLFFLVRNRGIVFSRDALLEKVWGFDFMGDDRTVDAQIKMLRHALEEHRTYIVTYRGAGYKFEADQKET